jgi:hypothetical protein
MVHAFYGVRTGFIRRGGVSFFTWLEQLAGVVVSFKKRCIFRRLGAECRFLVRVWTMRQDIQYNAQPFTDMYPATP